MREVFKCFHCRQSMTEDEARVHFGDETKHKPECWMYPRNMRDILQQNEDLRWFARQIFNAIDTSAVRLETEQEETLENVLARGRSILKQEIAP